MTDELIVKNFKYKSATAKVYIYPNGEAWVYEVHAKKKRKGHGTNLMRKIVTWADKKGYTLRLQANAWGKKSFKKNSDLAAFYMRFGFTIDDNQPVFLTR